MIIIIIIIIINETYIAQVATQLGNGAANALMRYSDDKNTELGLRTLLLFFINKKPKIRLLGFLKRLLQLCY